MPVSLSHRVLPPALHPELDWLVSMQGTPLSDRASSAPDWNYHLGIDVDVDVRLTANAAVDALGLGSASQLGIVLAASSSVPGTLAVREPVLAESTHLHIHVPGPMVGGSLRFTVTVVVLSADAPADGLAPTSVGAIVYRRHRDLTLEGTGARLPLLPISFEDQGLENAESAMWWLKVLSTELDRPSDDSLWLWVNTDSSVMRGVLNQPEADDSKLWRRLLQWDFTRQLLGLALGAADLQLTDEYPEHSLGAVLVGVVRLLSDDLEALRADHAHDPGHVEARLQAAVLGLNEETSYA